jgi:hypothetical protein
MFSPLGKSIFPFEAGGGGHVSGVSKVTRMHEDFELHELF